MPLPRNNLSIIAYTRKASDRFFGRANLTIRLTTTRRERERKERASSLNYRVLPTTYTRGMHRDASYGYRSCSREGRDRPLAESCLNLLDFFLLVSARCLPGCDEQHGHCNRPDECLWVYAYIYIYTIFLSLALSLLSLLHDNISVSTYSN